MQSIYGLQQKFKRRQLQVRKGKQCFVRLSNTRTKTRKKTHSLKSELVTQTGSEDAPKEQKEMTKVGKKNTKLIALKFHPAGEGSEH